MSPTDVLITTTAELSNGAKEIKTVGTHRKFQRPSRVSLATWKESGLRRKPVCGKIVSNGLTTIWFPGRSLGTSVITGKFFSLRQNEATLIRIVQKPLSIPLD